MVNANSNVELSNEKLVTEDAVVGVRECVDKALAYVGAIADEYDDDLNGEWFEFYMETYMDQVNECMN
ncbi:hypothetical protein [uncultured Lutibacter sp.]|uniref:hypothetical protein n=1 Tax=uncultured Lutibacter sp. TaxID=437739 RepID=UPI00261ACB6E|nr:hypothetical protein [uncultured Lutibacter sp.]